ncbi:MAG: tetratricopeptide repeat protein [Bacteroidota bacterium]
MSNHRNDQRDLALKKLAERFEGSYQRGQHIFLSQEEFEDLLSYYFGHEEFDQALSVADVAIRHYKFTPEFYKWKALLHKINAHEEAAMQALEQLNIFAPADVESLMLRLEILVHFDRRDDARDTLDQLTLIVDSKEHRSGLVYYDGILLLQEGQVAPAFTAFCESIRLDPHQEAAMAEIIENQSFHRKLTSFIELLRELLEADSFNDLLWFYLGLSQDLNGDDVAAHEAFGFALALNDLRPDYQLEYADKLFDLDRFDQALKAYRRYFSLPEAEHSYETSMRMGRSYQMLENYHAAKDAYLRAAELAPNMYDIYQHLAECCLAEEKWGAAAHYYERSVNCPNHTADCWLGIAYCSATTNEPVRAEEAFLKALEMQPQNSDASVTYALFLVEQGRERDALGVIENARNYPIDAALAYGTVAINLVCNKRRAALMHLSEALSNYYDEHIYLLEWCPELADDPEIVAMLQLYK